MAPTTYYPDLPPAPSYNGDLLTVAQQLQSPTELRNLLDIRTLPRFISPFLFGHSGANGGAVDYDVAAAPAPFLNANVNYQPGEIANGGEFPNVMVDDVSAQIAVVKHYGGQFPVTYKERRRNRRDVVGRGLLKLANTLVKQSDQRAITALNNNGVTPRVAAIAAWSNAGSQKAIDDILIGKGAVENLDMGYTIDTVIINPATAGLFMRLSDVRGMLPRENVARSPIFNPSLDGLLGLRWVQSSQQPIGEVTLVGRQVVGYIAEEIPQYSRVVDDPKIETYWCQAARLDVPVITDPLAAYTITGVNS